MADQNCNDPTLYREILHIVSQIETLQNKVSELEKAVQEIAKLRKPKKNGRVSFSSLQQEILRYLKSGPKTQAEVQEALRVPQPSISHSLDRLEKEYSIVESRPTTKPGARFEYILKKQLPKDILDLISRL